MNYDYMTKIINADAEVKKFEKIINDKILSFITKANELVELSSDVYQIEKTIKLNKISLKSYLLDSSCCLLLQKNSIDNYSIDELKYYLMEYEKFTTEDCSSYYLAISLYEQLEEIEKIVDEKINWETNQILEFTKLVNEIKNITSSEYENLYNQIKNTLKEKYLLKNLIDNNSYETCVHILNDIFNFYINGYPSFPTEY